MVEPNVYELALPEAFKHLHQIFNVAVLKWYCCLIVPPPDPTEVERLEEFEVSDTLAHCCSDCCKQLEFLVTFEGYDSSANKWLLESHLQHPKIF